MPGSRGLGCHQHPASRGPRSAQPWASVHTRAHTHTHTHDSRAAAPAHKPGAMRVSFIAGTPRYWPVTEGRATLHSTRAPSASQHEAVGSQGTGVSASKAQTNSQHPAWGGRALKRRAFTAGSKHTPPPRPQGWGPEARAPAQQPRTRPPPRGT